MPNNPETAMHLTPAEAAKMIEAIKVPREPSERARAAAKFAKMVFRKEAESDV